MALLLKKCFFMKVLLTSLLLFSLYCSYSQVFNDFYIKQQINFYKKGDSELKALETLKNFLLAENKNQYVDNCDNEYCSEVLRLLFTTNLPQEYYHYIPTVYYKKDNYIIFETDIIESIDIDGVIENVVYANVLIPVNLSNFKIILNDENITFLPNINEYNFGQIKIISNNKNQEGFEDELKSIKKYIKTTAKKLHIPDNNITNSPLTIISSSTLNDGYFYYGINKYLGYVNNYSNNKIFAGVNPIFYEHEIIHYLLNIKVQTKKINPIVNEGLATWIGGSLNLKYEDFIQQKIQNVDKPIIQKMINNFLLDTDFSDDSSYDYSIRAVFIKSLLGDKNEIESEKLNFLLSEKLANKSINEILVLMNLDIDNLKQKMLNEFEKHR